MALGGHIIFQTPTILLKDLYRNVTVDTDTCINWLKTNGLLANAMFCDSCGSECSFVSRKGISDGKSWKCRRRECRNRASIRRGSFFADHNLPLTTMVEMIYWWCMDVEQKVVKQQLGISSNHTMVDWFNYCRDICTAYLLDYHAPIGGPGVEVEVDESKFMHRKYHRGEHVDGQWYLGLIERRDPSKCIIVACPNNSRSADALLPLIIHNVLPGSVILSDMWAAYNTLGNHNYQHLSVNHRLHFRDPNTGVHTNLIEGTWAHAKRKIRKMYGTSNDLHSSYLSEFVWRRKFPERQFEHMVHQISEFYIV